MEKNKGGTKNKNRQNLGKLMTNIEVREILSDCQVDMSKGSDKDTDDEMQSGPMNNLDKLGPKTIRDQRATSISSQLLDHAYSILVDPGIE